MRTSNRDRSRFRVASCSIALILLSALLVFSASGLNASYFVYDNATGYHAAVEITDSERHDFIKPGILGEKVPLEVSNITLLYENQTSAEFKNIGRSISFEKGNYTVVFDAKVSNKNFQALFGTNYNITLHLPPGYDVRNPLLGMVSSGGNVETSELNGNETIIIEWTKKTFCEARFYDDFQLELLIIFGTFWMAIAVIFLVPYIMTRKKE
ncbi:DUF5803 family protein [Methanomicrobium antiquum]|uniref:DUF5803 family protein n=1 Tax=Methanomicrobium antiquum TaxID=487686 RepID=A0AAF0JLQ7_9EURY|nr:DUF5803 family protein [Methanomicrobium antiquum]MDD3978257.1 DUF5803 family protein [Methanomicrobium sp.]WFN36954.1 DUF5803 family protein [Methanomicrobium antiquum]